MLRSRKKQQTAMRQTSIRIAAELLAALDLHRPKWKTLPRFVEDQLEKVVLDLDSAITLGKPTTGAGRSLPVAHRSLPLASPAPREEVLPSINRDIDAEKKLRAEEAHIEPEALQERKRTTREIPSHLKELEPEIKAFWRAKPKTKTEAAWKLLMTELGKIQQHYGSSVVREQLALAEAHRFQSVTLRNYEQFGRPLANNGQRFAAPETRHPQAPIVGELSQEAKRNAVNYEELGL